MTRMSKQGERRNRSPRRPRVAGPKTGPKEHTFKPHDNVLGEADAFFPKVRGKANV